MSDLVRIERRIEELKAQAAQLSSQIERLEMAASVVRELHEEPARQSDAQADDIDANRHRLHGVTAHEAAKYVLRAYDIGGGGMQYREIFERAVALGWDGKRDSIRHIMGSNTGTFAKRGYGVYRLREIE